MNETMARGNPFTDQQEEWILNRAQQVLTIYKNPTTSNGSTEAMAHAEDSVDAYSNEVGLEPPKTLWDAVLQTFLLLLQSSENVARSS